MKLSGLPVGITLEEAINRANMRKALKPHRDFIVLDDWCIPGSYVIRDLAWFDALFYEHDGLLPNGAEAIVRYDTGTLDGFEYIRTED